MYEDLKIGTIVYAVHTKWAKENIQGGKIQVCRVKTFENKAGKILPVLTVVGNSRSELNTANHELFLELPKAIDAIRTK